MQGIIEGVMAVGYASGPAIGIGLFKVSRLTLNCHLILEILLCSHKCCVLPFIDYIILITHLHTIPYHFIFQSPATENLAM